MQLILYESDWHCFPPAPLFSDPAETHCVVRMHAPVVQAVLEHPSIRKFGIGINGYFKTLNLHFQTRMRGIVDVKVKTNRWMQTQGCVLTEYTNFTLAEQCKRLLRRQLPKPQGECCGCWEQFPLSPEQRYYAAMDMYASLLVGQVVLKLQLLPGVAV
jgi:acyl-homoserine lactone acylase PvdQ